MKLLFDLFPVILFFAAFKFSEARPAAAADLLAGLLGPLGTVAPAQAPILVATVVVILATVGQIFWVRIRHGHVDKMLWTSLALVVFFGGMTLVFHDETFIKWKPTVLYWLFAATLLGATLFTKKNLIRQMLGEKLELPDPVWQRLNLSWIGFFTAMGFANLYVAFSFPTEIWVNFKLFGGMGLMFAFVVAQSMMLSKYVQEEKK